jgi:hypothetical protein
VSFVLAGANLTDIGTAQVIYDGPQKSSAQGGVSTAQGGVLPSGVSTAFWGAVGSSIGVGAQYYCGQTQTGTTCSGGNNEIERGSCTAETLFGADMDYSCRSGDPSLRGTVSSNCPFITMEVHSQPQTQNLLTRHWPL